MSGNAAILGCHDLLLFHFELLHSPRDARSEVYLILVLSLDAAMRLRFHFVCSSSAGVLGAFVFLLLLGFLLWYDWWVGLVCDFLPLPGAVKGVLDGS